jgi:hypothetical protein
MLFNVKREMVMMLIHYKENMTTVVISQTLTKWGNFSKNLAKGFRSKVVLTLLTKLKWR